MTCPSCRQDDPRTVEPGCIGSDGEPMVFVVCGNCDYGINEHTEDVCDCLKVNR